MREMRSQTAVAGDDAAVGVVGQAARDDRDDHRLALRGALERELDPVVIGGVEHERAGVEGRLEVGRHVGAELEVALDGGHEPRRAELRRAARGIEEEVRARPGDDVQGAVEAHGPIGGRDLPFERHRQATELHRASSLDGAA